MDEHLYERCPVPVNDPLFSHYHDTEWGVPQDSDRVFFEKICLEGFQSGLSWQTILYRRDAFRRAFAGFDPAQIASMSERDVERLMQDAGIIRNRRKIRSVINNAARALELQARCGSLAGFFWDFEPANASRPTRMNRQWLKDNPHTVESAALAKALKQQGWSFVGPVNMYALMQALGIVNDHVHRCPRRAVVERLREQFERPVRH